MSIRAIKIIEIKLAERSTFSFSNNWIFNQLDTSGLGDECGGILTITEDQLNEMFDELENDVKLTGEEKEEAREILELIKKDIGDMEYVEYMCG